MPCPVLTPDGQHDNRAKATQDCQHRAACTAARHSGEARVQQEQRALAPSSVLLLRYPVAVQELNQWRHTGVGRQGVGGEPPEHLAPKPEFGTLPFGQLVKFVVLYIPGVCRQAGGRRAAQWPAGHRASDGVPQDAGQLAAGAKTPPRVCF